MLSAAFSNHIPFFAVDLKSRTLYFITELIKEKGVGDIRTYKANMWKDGIEKLSIIKCKEASPIERDDWDNTHPLESACENMIALQQSAFDKESTGGNSTQGESFNGETDDYLGEFGVAPGVLGHGKAFSLPLQFSDSHYKLLEECAYYNSSSKSPSEDPYIELSLQLQACKRNQVLKYFSMEYVKGYTLNELVFAKGSFSSSIARCLFRQLINNLRILHSKKIAHLNLKLDHAIVDTNGNALFIGYGLSRKVTKSREIHGGTPPYCAKEIYEGTCQSLFACDIFSMGVLLFALINCRFPFAEALPQKFLYSSIAKKEFSDFWTAHENHTRSTSSVSVEHEPELKNLLEHMLEVEPELRPSLAELVVHPWVNSPSAPKTELEDEVKQRTMKYYDWKMTRNVQRVKASQSKQIVANVSIQF
eukprot:TRINITY_DN2229_c0_g1_i1.p1 TRINITY_DN2229_c0_g1~~TRINITY_DN2229_c0_g1_i1.p1  ORF type:complete len:420 (-),score=9.47 TRINITY_DN2229_c0_g1_i1:521-1780(-)